MLLATVPLEGYLEAKQQGVAWRVAVNEVLGLVAGMAVIGGLAVVLALRKQVDRKLSSSPDSTRDHPLPQMDGSRSFRLAVVGESHDNEDGTSRQQIIRGCRAGEPIRLVLEPYNPYDKRAVKVCRQSGEQVGYLPRGHGLFKKIKDGRVSAAIDGIHGGTPGKPSVGVVLAVTVKE